MTLARIHNPIRQVLAPQRVLLLSCFMVLMVAFAGSQYLLDQPYYGLKPVAESGVISVRLPSGGRTRLAAIGHGEAQFAPGPEDIRPDPDFLNSFAAIEQYFYRQSQLYSLLLQGEILVVDAAGESHPVKARPTGLATIPATFWLLNLSGAVAFLTGMAFWAYHRGRIITRILAAGGSGCYLMQATMALYASREFALDGSTFLTLLHLNHLGGILFVSSLVMLLWFYPSTLGNTRALWLVYGAALLIWLNEIQEWIAWPISLFYFPAILLTLFAFWLFYRQWRCCRDDPRKRAMYFWLVNSLLAGIGLTFVCYIAPIMIYGEPLVSTWVANTFCLLVFLGFVLGVQYSGLFAVEHWWLKACVSVVLAFAVIWLDLIAITLLGLQSALGLSLVAVVCFWLYLQLRNKCRQWLAGRGSGESLVKGVMAGISPEQRFRSGPDCLPEQALLQSLYQPICAETSPVAFARPLLLENGLKLGFTIPLIAVGDAISEPVSLVFIGKMGGRELFSEDDADFTRQFIEHAGETHRLHLAREATLLAERQRIMRDLHDELAPDLASLLRGLEGSEYSGIARRCLANLRDIVYSMDDEKERALWEAVARWRRELGELVRSAGADIQWQDNLREDRILSGSQWLQLSRAIRELINNALRHAAPTRISITLTLQENTLVVEVVNNGCIETVSSWKTGKGTVSIKKRAQQLLGRVDWETSGKECRAVMSVPL